MGKKLIINENISCREFRLGWITKQSWKNLVLDLKKPIVIVNCEIKKSFVIKCFITTVLIRCTR